MPVLPLEAVPLELGNAPKQEDAGILLAADRGGGARGAWAGGVDPFYYVPPLDLCPTSRGK